MEKTFCRRCVLDSEVPGVKFDANGICNYCHMQDKLDAALA